MSRLVQILSLPVADVKTSPLITPSDAIIVAHNLEKLLTKCFYCIRGGISGGLGIFLTMIARAMEHQSAAVCHAMHLRAGDTTCLNMFCEVVAHVLSESCAPLREGFDCEVMFDVLQSLCSDASTKTKLGELISAVLLSFMGNSAQHVDDYRVPRSCASALITLLRGSSANKNRLCPECTRIAEALELSSDFFFQMQCVELLFRLHIHNRSAITQAPMNEYLRRGICALPNDATLLLSIQSLLDNYNAEFNTNTVKAFTVIRIEAGGSEVCGHTTMFFSQSLVVVCIPGGTGDSFTIPYEHIRSVKLSKDHRLALRLHTIPPKLSLLMELSDGRDTVSVFLTEATLARLRSCGVHEWISERKRRAAVRHNVPLSIADSNAPVARSAPRGRANNSQGCPMTERDENQANVAEDVLSQKSLQSNIEQSSTLEEIHRAAATKAVRFREQHLEQLQHASDLVQEELSELQRLNARDRDSFEVSFREDMITIRRSETTLKDTAAECVRLLNSELEDVQTLGGLLRSEIDKLRESVANALGRSEGAEDACLIRIKAMVDAEIQGVEQQMLSVLEDGNPLGHMSQYVMTRINALGSLCTSGEQPKARRLEYS